MPKFNLKKISKILFVFVMFFSCLKVVSAKEWYYKTITNIKDKNVNLFSACNSDNGCVPLCIYSEYHDAYDFAIDRGWDADEYGDEVALIGYYYEKDQFDHNWQIAYFNQNSQPKASTRIETLYYSNDTFIPKTYIYWKENLMEWNNSSGYEKLDSSFTCPGILYTDSGRRSGNELCFGDAVDDHSCEKIGGGASVNFASHDQLRLTYSFADDNFRNVMNNTITKLEVHDSDAPDYALLASVDSSFQYNGTGITEANCNYFKETLADSESYSARITTKDNVDKYKTSIINPILKDEAKAFNVRYPQAYSFDGLERMLMEDYDKNFRNIGGNEKNFSNIDKLFYDRLVDTMTKGVAECNTTYNTGIDNYDASTMYDAMRRKYNEVSIPAPAKIDFSENFDCGIFDDEITSMIQTGYFIIELLSIVILIAFSVLDYAKVIFNGDSDQMKKSNGNLFKRIIIVAVIFILPAILNFALRLFKIEGFNSEHPLCVEMKK